MEVKIVACFEARTHVKWLRNFISRLKIVNSISKSLRILSDKYFAISYAKSTKNTSGAKYIELSYFKLKA